MKNFVILTHELGRGSKSCQCVSDSRTNDARVTILCSAVENRYSGDRERTGEELFQVRISMTESFNVSLVLGGDVIPVHQSPDLFYSVPLFHSTLHRI